MLVAFTIDMIFPFFRLFSQNHLNLQLSN